MTSPYIFEESDFEENSTNSSSSGMILMLYLIFEKKLSA